jgi:hypothetical protein
LISSSDFPSQESFGSRHVANLDLETAQITRWIPSPLNACAADKELLGSGRIQGGVADRDCQQRATPNRHR